MYCMYLLTYNRIWHGIFNTQLPRNWIKGTHVADMQERDPILECLAFLLLLFLPKIPKTSGRTKANYHGGKGMG